MMSENPWQVDNIQAFWFLKCPECPFDSKEEKIFQTHAILNHPLSYVLFPKTQSFYQNGVEIDILNSIKTEKSSEKPEGCENYSNEVQVHDGKKPFQVSTEEPQHFEECSVLKVDASNQVCDLNEEFIIKEEFSELKSDPLSIHEEFEPVIKKSKIIYLNHRTSNKEEENIVETKTQAVQINEVPKRNESLPCFICKKIFHQKYFLKAHIETVHEGKKPFKCTLCVSKFPQKVHLKLHIENVHEKKKPFTCSQCDASFGRKDVLKGHIKAVHDKIKPFVCSICNHGFSARNKLKSHAKSIHKMKISDKEDLSIHERLEPYIKKLDRNCLKQTSNNEEENISKGNIVPTKTQSAQVEVFQEKNDTNFCFICKKLFHRKSALTAHIESVHEGKKPFKCSLCVSEFPQKVHLKLHIETVHEKKKPFTCSQCDASFGRKDVLKGHIKAVHDKIKPFVCSICNHSFSTRQDLKKHAISIHEMKIVK